MKLSQQNAEKLKAMALDVRQKAYQCGALDHEDRRDERPPDHTTVAARTGMEAATKQFDDFVATITRNTRKTRRNG